MSKGLIWQTDEDKEREELAKEIEREALLEEQKKREAVERFVQFEATRLIEAGELTEEQKNDFLDLFDPWHVGRAYPVGAKVRHNGVVYDVLQAHTSQADWQPADVPALYVEYLQRSTTDDEGNPVDVVSEWVRPTGAHNAYAYGSLVSYEGAVYKSTIDNNVWSPSEYPTAWEPL